MEVSHGFLESAKSSKSLDHVSIETHGDSGIPHFKKPPYTCIYNSIYIYMYIYI
jgi:hypothetical protein